MPRRVHLDLELAGTLDLRNVGMDVWAKHPNTVPILVGYAFDDDPPVSYEWANSAWCSERQDLLAAVQAGVEIHAWNAAFERTIWNNLLVRLGYPQIPLEQFHCTMAAAAVAGLPMDLGGAAEAVGSPAEKDKEGRALMLRMARPRSHKDDGTPRWWHEEDPAKLALLHTYNLADVEAEREVFRRIPRMSDRERRIWLADQRMNDRGLPVDQRLLQALASVTLDELLRVNAEIKRVTKGKVESNTQRARLLDWLRGEGYLRGDLRQATIEDCVHADDFHAMTQDGQNVLLLRAEAAKTSTAKLGTLGAYSQIDGRARHLVQYGGAIRTLRWAGRGPQIQNFPRPSIKHVGEAIEQILQGMNGEGLRQIFGKPLDVVSSCLRGVFLAPAGYKFVVCDYHAVEAIVLAWLANHNELLEVFRRGEDVYVYTAGSVGSGNRTLGKVLRLACGYGMGADKFQATAATYGLILSIGEAHEAVRHFREANKPIVSLWHKTEGSASAVIRNPSYVAPQGHGKVEIRMASPKHRVKGSLLIKKPSGGYLVYRDAKVRDGRIVYSGVHQVTHQWCEIDTYGGKLVENITQSVARDLLAEIMLLVESAYPDALVATIHDEIVLLVPSDHALMVASDLKRWMSTPPAWGQGLPLSASGYIADRYAKG